jgi:hypothetical protein
MQQARVEGYVVISDVTTYVWIGPCGDGIDLYEPAKVTRHDTPVDPGRRFSPGAESKSSG